MNQNSNFLTGILSITQKGGMTLLRGANNDTQPLSAFKDGPVWPARPQHESLKGKEINRMPTHYNSVIVFKHVENYQPSLTSIKQQFGKRDTKKNPLTQEEQLIAAIMDWACDSFGSLDGVSFIFQSSDGQQVITKIFNYNENKFC